MVSVHQVPLKSEVKYHQKEVWRGRKQRPIGILLHSANDKCKTVEDSLFMQNLKHLRSQLCQQ